MLYFCALLCLIISIWCLYKYYETDAVKFVILEWALVVSASNFYFSTFGEIISKLGAELIVFLLPVGIYYLTKLCKKHKWEKVVIIPVFCTFLLSVTIPINKFFDDIAIAINPAYSEQKAKDEQEQQKKKNEKEKNSLQFDREFSFKYEAQLAVLGCLKAPKTAEFDPYDDKCFRDGDTKEWVYTGFVTSQNGFGALLTKEYFVCFSPDGQYLTKVVFEDRVIPINRKVKDWNKWGPKLNRLENEQ